MTLTLNPSMLWMNKTHLSPKSQQLSAKCFYVIMMKYIPVLQEFYQTLLVVDLNQMMWVFLKFKTWHLKINANVPLSFCLHINCRPTYIRAIHPYSSRSLYSLPRRSAIFTLLKKGWQVFACFTHIACKMTAMNRTHITSKFAFTWCKNKAWDSGVTLRIHILEEHPQ